MNREQPQFINPKIEERTDSERFNTIFKKIKPEEDENSIRIESFKNLSQNMREALSRIGEAFKDANITYPWAIHGSTALVLEGETAKQPVDIDLAFGKPDFENVFAEFKKMEEKGLVRKLKTEEMKNFENQENGCTKISTEIKTGENPEVWIEMEAFAQNVDPKQPKNGITNPGLEKTKINIYDENGVEINFADREENFKFYLQVAYTELQKYQMDNRFMHIVKNKFPQRLQNIIAIIKREEMEEFDEKFKKGEITKDQKPQIENIIDKLIKEFIKYNSQNESLKLNDFAHSKIDPVKTMQARFDEFKNQRSEDVNLENKGFVRQKIENKKEGDPSYGREKAVDDLTIDNLNDMEHIASIHKKLINLNLRCENLKKCDDKTISEITETSDEVLESISKLKNDYEKYLNMINYKDNRDFIPYVAIKETLDEYIIPALELAIMSQGKIENVLEEVNL